MTHVSESKKPPVHFEPGADVYMDEPQPLDACRQG